MSTLFDVLPLQKKTQIPKDNEKLQTLTKVRSFVNLGSSLFGNQFMEDPMETTELTRAVNDKEYNLVKGLWDEFEFVPEEFSRPISSNVANAKVFPAANLSSYPVTYVDKIIRLADSLKMVIIPLEYTDFAAILEAHGYDRYSDLFHAVSKATKDVKVAGGQMYIICPISYYSFWNEVTLEDQIEKYYPEDFESIFTTIELMIPSQKNLYKMAKTNESNIKTVQKDMEDNFDKITTRLKKVEQRVSKVEQQMEQVKAEMERQAEENKRLARRLEEVRLERQRYAYLDPLVFFTSKRIKSFEEITSDIKAHVVACFGPEFPAEFFTMNGFTILKHPKDGKKIVFKHGEKKNNKSDYNEESGDFNYNGNPRISMPQFVVPPYQQPMMQFGYPYQYPYRPLGSF